MNKEIKYYLFYLIERDENQIEISRKLYAYTDDKKIAKKFKEERDNNQFHMVTMYPSKEEIHDIALEYKDLILSDKGLKFFNSKTGVSTPGSLVMTREEYLTVHRRASSLILQELPIHTWISPYIFKQKTFEALDTLGYVSFYKEIESGYSEDEISVVADEVAIFIHYFGKTLKEGN